MSKTKPDASFPHIKFIEEQELDVETLPEGIQESIEDWDSDYEDMTSDGVLSESDKKELLEGSASIAHAIMDFIDEGQTADPAPAQTPNEPVNATPAPAQTPNEPVNATPAPAPEPTPNPPVDATATPNTDGTVTVGADASGAIPATSTAAPAEPAPAKKKDNSFFGWQ